MQQSAFWLAIIHCKKSPEVLFRVYSNPAGGLTPFCTYLGDINDMMLFNSEYCGSVAQTYESLVENIRKSDCPEKDKFLTEEFLGWLQATLTALDG